MVFNIEPTETDFLSINSGAHLFNIKQLNATHAFVELTLNAHGYH